MLEIALFSGFLSQHIQCRHNGELLAFQSVVIVAQTSLSGHHAGVAQNLAADFFF